MLRLLDFFGCNGRCLSPIFENGLVARRTADGGAVRHFYHRRRYAGPPLKPPDSFRARHVRRSKQISFLMFAFVERGNERGCSVADVDNAETSARAIRA